MSLASGILVEPLVPRVRRISIKPVSDGLENGNKQKAIAYLNLKKDLPRDRMKEGSACHLQNIAN
jgi:hypothetical protein